MSDSQDTKKKVVVGESESSGENEGTTTEDSLYMAKDDEIQVRVANMSKENQARYETFRRSNFPKAGIKKLIALIIGQAVNPNMVIGVAGLSKVFIGEMVEEALEIQEELGLSGPLLPSHIHEAYRRIYNRSPFLKTKPKEPWNR